MYQNICKVFSISFIFFPPNIEREMKSIAHRMKNTIKKRKKEVAFFIIGHPSHMTIFLDYGEFTATASPPPPLKAVLVVYYG